MFGLSAVCDHQYRRLNMVKVDLFLLLLLMFVRNALWTSFYDFGENIHILRVMEHCLGLCIGMLTIIPISCRLLMTYLYVEWKCNSGSSIYYVCLIQRNLLYAASVFKPTTWWLLRLSSINGDCDWYIWSNSKTFSGELELIS